MTTDEPRDIGGADDGADAIAAIQRAEQAERMAAVSDFDGPPKKKRRVLKIGGGLLLVLLVLIGVAPLVAGPVLRPIAEQRLTDALGATVRIDRVSLNWFAGPRVEGLTILDESLQEQADLTVRSWMPLFQLVMSPRDIGKVSLEGSLILERRADGSIAPFPPPGETDSDPIELPDLSAIFLTDKLNIEWRELHQPPLKLSVSQAHVDYAPSELDAQLVFSAEHELGAAELSIAGRASDLAVVDGTIVFSSGVLAFTSTGDAIEAEFATLISRTDAGYRVTLDGDEVSARLAGPVLSKVLPDLAALVEAPVTVADGRVFTLDSAPGVSVRVTDAAATLDPSTFALSDTRFEAVLETTELTGTLDGEPWRIDPLLGSAATRNMIDGIDVEAVTSVTLGGGRAGELSLLSDGLRVLRAEGSFMDRIPAMIAGSRTTLDVSGVSTAVLEPLIAPLLERTGIVPSRDLGPEVSAEFAVTPGPQTGLRLELESENVAAAVGLRVDGTMLRTTEEGSRISVQSATGFLTDAFARAGLIVDEGAAIDMRISELAFDLESFEPGGPIDLGGLSGMVNASIGRTSGRATVDGVERSFVLRPSEAEIDLRRLRERATVVAGAAVEIDGRSAGTLNVSIDATEILDADGSLREGVPPLAGEIALRNVRTTLLGPWLEPVLGPAGVTPERILGESADLLIIGTQGDGGQVRLQTTLRSGGLAGGGDLVIDGGVVRSAGTMRFEHTNAGSIAADMLAGALDESVRVESGGTLTLAIESMAFGRDTPALFDAAMAVTGLELAADDGDRTELERLNIAMAFAPEGRSVELNGLGSVGERPVVLGGRLDFDSQSAATGDAPIWWLSPRGRVDLTVPTSAAALVARDDFLMWSDAVSLTIGDALNTSVVADDGVMILTATGSSQAAAAELVARTGDRSLRVERGSLEARVTEEAIRQIRLARVTRSEGPPQRPMIASDASLSIDLGAFGLMTDGRFAPSGSATVRLEASGAISGLHETTIIGSDSLPRRVREGMAGLDAFMVESQLPIGALFSGETAALGGSLRGTLTGEEGRAIAQLAGTIEAQLAAGALDGPLALNVDLLSIDTALLDDSLRTDSFMSGLLGASASASLQLSGIGEAMSVSDAGLTVSVDSPRLSVEEPMVFDIQPDRMRLSGASRVRVMLDPVFATRHLLHQSPGEERVRLAEAIDASLVVDRLTLARGGTPFLPGVFDAHAEVSAPRIIVDQREEVDISADITAAPWLRTDLSPLTGSVVTGTEAGAVLRLNAGTEGASSLVAEISLRGVTAGMPVLGVVVEGVGIPSRLMDGLGDFEGGLAEILGPTARFRVAVQELSRDSGTVNASIVGDRASASLIGRVDDGVFRNEDPVMAQVDVIRPQLGARMSRAIPALGRVTKSREDGPATLTATNVSFALGQDPRLRGFDADFVIDVGTARFRASRAFGDVLILARQRAESEVGRRLEPMTGTIRGGLLSYEPLKLPLGEFTITSEGSYDLVTRQTDVMTAIPLGALSDQAMGELNTGLGSQLSRLLPGVRGLTMVPWRVRGVPGELTITPDINEFRRQITRTINPVNIIGNIFGT